MLRSLTLKRLHSPSVSLRHALRTLSSTTNTVNSGFLSFLDQDKTRKIEYRDRVDIDTGRPLNPDQKRRVVDNAIMNNLNLRMREIFQKRYWNIEDFNRQNKPIVIDKIEDRTSFSSRDSKELWTLDLPLKMPGKGWAVPSELAQFTEFIEKADRFEQIINPKYDECYAYLSIDQRSVEPGRSQRRPGYHADSFVTPSTHGDIDNIRVLHDSIYVVSDCIPTIFNPGPFPFDQDIASNPQLALDHFEKNADPQLDNTYDSYRIIKMDPTVVHRVGFNTGSHSVDRTFAKLVYSTEIFNRVGNDMNGLLDYNWPMIERNMELRNTSSVHTKMINGHSHEDYRYVSPHLLKQIMNRSRYAFPARKNGCITAYPATPGELLQTVVRGSITTQNRAKVGDWKVTTYLGDQYFLSLESLNRYYEHIGTTHLKKSDYNFISRPDIVLALQIDKLMRLSAPWGTDQYLMPGDYLVLRGKSEIYGVKRDSFETNYSPI